MNALSPPRLISQEELPYICGALGAEILFLLELPHLIMGAREFVNYMGERWQHGCQADEGDYFTSFFCCYLPLIQFAK